MAIFQVIEPRCPRCAEPLESASGWLWECLGCKMPVDLLDAALAVQGLPPLEVVR